MSKPCSTYSFDLEESILYGIEEALLLQGFRYYIGLHAASGTQFYEGRYWVYNSRASLLKLHPYLTEAKLRSSLDNLIENGVLLRGNFNKKEYDKTSWYAFTDEYLEQLDPSIKNYVENDPGEIHQGPGDFNQGPGEINPTIPIYTPIYKSIYKNKVKNICSNEEKSIQFEQFYGEYPRHVGKEQAKKAFLKLSPDKTLFQTIIEKLKLQKEMCTIKSDNWLKEGKKYCPMPSTWLNNRRWEDEIVEPKSSKWHPNDTISDDCKSEPDKYIKLPVHTAKTIDKKEIK